MLDRQAGHLGEVGCIGGAARQCHLRAEGGEVERERGLEACIRVAEHWRERCPGALAAPVEHVLRGRHEHAGYPGLGRRVAQRHAFVHVERVERVASQFEVAVVDVDRIRPVEQRVRDAEAGIAAGHPVLQAAGQRHLHRWRHRRPERAHGEHADHLRTSAHRHRADRAEVRAVHVAREHEHARGHQAVLHREDVAVAALADVVEAPDLPVARGPADRRAARRRARAQVEHFMVCGEDDAFRMRDPVDAQRVEFAPRAFDMAVVHEDQRGLRVDDIPRCHRGGAARLREDLLDCRHAHGCARSRMQVVAMPPVFIPGESSRRRSPSPTCPSRTR